MGTGAQRRRTVLGLLLATAMLWLAVPSAAEARHHKVRPGQSLSLIANRYGVSTWDLAAANDMRPNSPIRPGQVLDVPSRGEVYARPGDTLSHIARRNDCSVRALARLNNIRGGRVRAGQRLILPGYDRASANWRDRDWGEPEQPGVVQIRDRRGDKVELRLVDDEGRVIAEALPELGELLRRHEDDPVETPAPRLAALLAAISDEFGGRRIKVVSGFREAGGYTKETSRHVSGRAADIQVHGVPRRAVWEYCRTLENTGCGYYPRSVFVHVDVRGDSAQWVDWSGPGRRPRYGSLRGPGKSRRHAMAARGRDTTNAEDVPVEVELVGELPEDVTWRGDQPTDDVRTAKQAHERAHATAARRLTSAQSSSQSEAETSPAQQSTSTETQ